MKQYSVMDLDPKDMPAFLNDLASEYFQDNFDIRMQLSQCSIYIHTVNSFLDKKKPSEYSVKAKGDTIRQMKTQVREKSDGPFFGCMGK